MTDGFGAGSPRCSAREVWYRRWRLMREEIQRTPAIQTRFYKQPYREIIEMLVARNAHDPLDVPLRDRFLARKSDEAQALAFELAMTDHYIELLWEVVFGPDAPMPTAEDSYSVGPRRTALKRLRGMCSRVEWPWVKQAVPERADLPIGVELEEE